MVTARDIRSYVINLPRRADRRAEIARALPPDLPVTFTSDWNGPFDGRELSRADLERTGHKLFPWPIASDNPWWSRPLKYGEIGCTLAHLACWRHAANTCSEPYILILEDDAVLGPAFLEELIRALERLVRHIRHFDLLYLGRYPLEPDHHASLPGFVVPGYSHCTYGYLLTRPALDVLLDTHLEHAIVPIDEFLPSLYIDHPRPDLRARFPRQLTAFACEPPLVRQRPKEEAGSDTEDSAFVTSR
ncbi:glycosyltransferase family 25 protein [Amycolatopsis sp. K13G38]|uniref:Glycosyltransferase family 25 protein n=1 Tax=Amycolatopsis acididurans TaxID=2724524 RepID=A0ABX1J8J0_9PSEU|nr:glycosyltransferase family 25 protein [Amycolatopsis acididurans]